MQIMNKKMSENRKTASVYGAPWPFRLIAGPLKMRTSWYSLYYLEEPSVGIKTDTPALDKHGCFLWCTNAKKLNRIRENLTEKFAKYKIKHSVNPPIDVVKALKGFEYETENLVFWNETISLLNLILDYMSFIPNDTEDERTIQLLEELSVHIFEGKDLPLFYEEHNTSKRRIVEQILYCLYRIYQNSRIV